MYIRDLLSQVSLFGIGSVSAGSFATWLFRNDDAFSEGLTDDDWELFTELQLLAAEFTGEHISEDRFRSEVSRLMHERGLLLPVVRGSGITPYRVAVASATADDMMIRALYEHPRSDVRSGSVLFRYERESSNLMVPPNH